MPAVTVNVADVDPAGTVTLEGTLAAVLSELESDTTTPPVPAAAVRLTVPVPDWPLTIVLGLTETLLRAACGAIYVNAVARLPLCPPGLVAVTVAAPGTPAGAVAVIDVPLTTTTLVAATPPNVTVAPATKFVPVMVTAVPPAVVPLAGVTLLTVGTGPETAKNVAICMTHGPDPVNVAVALLLPAAVTILSSARSPSGAVMIRDVNPLPAVPFSVATVLAPKINSLATVVVAAPLLAVVLLPLAPAVTSSAVTPLYSKIRTSGYAAAWLNVTVTVLLPPTMFAA